MAKKKKSKSPPPFKTWLISGLRKLSQRWPPYYETLNRVKYYINIIDVIEQAGGYYRIITEENIAVSSRYKPNLGRRIVLQCEHCKKYYLIKDKYKLKNGKTKLLKTVIVDHIIPVVNPETGFNGWDEYINGMFPQGEGIFFQAICRDCHNIKGEEERDGKRQREEARRESKPPAKGTKRKIAGAGPKKSTRCVRRSRPTCLRRRR